jgi:hypothetical protein
LIGADRFFSDRCPKFCTGSTADGESTRRQESKLEC